MLRFVLVLAALSTFACGSGPQPVHVPPSHAAVPVGQCAEVILQSEWDNRSPVPASGLSAQCADTKICSAQISNKRAGVVFAQGLAVGATSLEMDYRDPVTGTMQHKATRVTFVEPATPPVGEPVPCDQQR